MNIKLRILSSLSSILLSASALAGGVGGSSGTIVIRAAEDPREAADILQDSLEHFVRMVTRNAPYSNLAYQGRRAQLDAQHFIRSYPMGVRHYCRNYRELDYSLDSLQRSFLNAHRIHHDNHIAGDYIAMVGSAEQLKIQMVGLCDHYDGGHGGGGHRDDDHGYRPVPGRPVYPGYPGYPGRRP